MSDKTSHWTICWVQKFLPEKVATLLHGDSPVSIVTKGTSEIFLIKIAGAGLAFIAQILLARLLGAEQYGLYTYALSWTLFLALVGKFGLEPASIRYVAAYIAKKEWALLRGYLRWSLRTATTTSGVISILAFTILYLLKGRVPEGTFLPFLIAFMLLPFIVLLATRSAALQGFKKMAMAQAPVSNILPILLVSGVFLVWFIGSRQVKAESAMLVHLVASIVCLTLVFYFIRVSAPPEITTIKPKYLVQDWRRNALILLTTTGFSLVIEQTDIILLGLFHGTTEAGIYSAAKKAASLITSGLIIVNVSVAPMISHLYVSGNITDLKRVIRLANAFSIVIALPGAIAVIIFSDWIMGLFGPIFWNGSVALLLLTIGQLINVLAGSVGYFMIMTGNEQFFAMIAGGCAFLNIVLNLLLIPSYGLEGAAISTASTVVLWNICLALYIYRKLQIDVSIFSILDMLRINHEQ